MMQTRYAARQREFADHGGLAKCLHYRLLTCTTDASLGKEVPIFLFVKPFKHSSTR
jgi:hypothetical protein